MNIIEQNKHKMFQTISKLLSTRRGVIDIFPGVAEKIELLKTNTARIWELAGVQMSDHTGITEEKDMMRTRLVSDAQEISLKFKAMALVRKKLELAKEVGIREYEFRRFTDEELISKIMHICVRAGEFREELQGYNITTEAILNLQSQVISFMDMMNLPREKKDEVKGITHDIKELFRQGDEMLMEMDILVEAVKRSDPEFYRDYKLARKRHESAGKTLSVIGKVTDKRAIPIPGVKVVLKSEADGTEFILKSATKGGFRKKNLPPGLYHVIAGKEGYEIANLTATVNPGERTNLKIELEKAEGLTRQIV